MSELVLSPTELEEILGAKTQPAQIKQLTEWKVPYLINRKGFLRVGRRAMEERLMGKKQPTAAENDPDFSAFEERRHGGKA